MNRMETAKRPGQRYPSQRGSTRTVWRKVAVASGRRRIFISRKLTATRPTSSMRKVHALLALEWRKGVEGEGLGAAAAPQLAGVFFVDDNHGVRPGALKRLPVGVARSFRGHERADSPRRLRFGCRQRSA